MNRLRDLLITVACRLLSIPFALLSPSVPAGRAFSSIVVIKPCCIGDVTLATPAVAALRRAYPQARIAFVVSSWAKEAVSHNPRLDEIVECGNVGSGRAYSWQEYLSLVRRIRKGRFELAVVLERSPVLSLIPFFAGVRRRAGVDSAGRGFSLTTKARWQAGQHEAELYLDVVRSLGIDPGKPQAEFFPSERERQSAESILAGMPGSAGPAEAETQLAMIHPGGAANPGMILSAKRWPADRYGEIARRFLEADWTVLVVGADSDRPAVDSLLATVGGAQSEKMVDLAGKLSLGEFAAIAGRCRVFVGNDTGPMHIAAAMGTPTVAVFGPSTPAMYAPYGPRAVAVYNKVDCSPCFVKGRFATDCRDFKCMDAVAVEHVWQAIKGVLKEQC